MNLLTAESVRELLRLEVISEAQAQGLLETLGGYRRQREALFAQWDAEKDGLLIAAELGLSESQRAAVLEADRLAIRFSLMAQRRGEGDKLLRESSQDGSSR